MARIFMAMNGKKINTLDDLRTNFNGKQMLDFYRAGRLQKWLEELGENDLLETLRDFQKENYDDETLLSMLMAAFELDEKTVSEQISIQKEESQKQIAEKALAAEPIRDEPEKPESPPEPEGEYTPEERSILKIRNKILSVMRTVFGDEMLDYEKHLDTSFVDFGISGDLQKKLKERLAVEFKFYPVGNESQVSGHDNGLVYAEESPFTVICSILKQFGPKCFRSKELFSPWDYEDIGFNTGIAYPKEYKIFLLSGKKAIRKKIDFGNLDEWTKKGDELSGNIGRLAAALKPDVPEYESADIKVAAELKYHRQKAVLALLEDHFQISSAPKTREQTLLLETDLKEQCGFEDKPIREFNKRLLALFPAEDHSGMGAHKKNATLEELLGNFYLKKARDAHKAISTVVQGVLDELDGTDSPEDSFFEYDAVTRTILHASIEDIFRFCHCL